MHMPLITCFSYIIIRNSTFLVIVLNSYQILELIGTDMKHKLINLKKSGILIMAVDVYKRQLQMLRLLRWNAKA